MALTVIACNNAKPKAKPYKLADRNGLYLLVTASGRYWRWDYRYLGKRKTQALGVFDEVTLADARNAHADGRKLLAAGVDPMAARQAGKLEALKNAENSFQLLALDWLSNVKRVKVAATTLTKVRRQLEQHVFPMLGHRPVMEITTPELLRVLRKVAASGVPYTATRMRETVGQIFRYGIRIGRASANPAAELAGGETLPVPKTKHRPALTTQREFGQFLRDLQAFTGADTLTLLATRMALLTFVRSQELRLAQWCEIDYEAKEWRIPSGRMKMAKGSNQAHVVPLSEQAITTLKSLQALTGATGSLFPNNNGADSFMSENTIGRMLWRLGYKGRQTLHGFRASARSLLSERGWSIEAMERQLDHAERSKVVAAYARSEYLVERRKIMDDWGALVDVMEAGTNVVMLVRAA